MWGKAESLRERVVDFRGVDKVSTNIVREDEVDIAASSEVLKSVLDDSECHVLTTESLILGLLPKRSSINLRLQVVRQRMVHNGGGKGNALGALEVVSVGHALHQVIDGQGCPDDTVTVEQ